MRPCRKCALNQFVFKLLNDNAENEFPTSLLIRMHSYVVNRTKTTNIYKLFFKGYEIL